MNNIFMKQVRDAITPSLFKIFKYFKFKRAYNKFVKSISTGSPSFGVLWYFGEFIQYAEILYFYDNSKSSYLYSSTEYSPGTNGFRINIDEAIITIKLWSDTQTIGIDIENKKGTKKKSNYTFVNNDWLDPPDEYDILLVDNIIDIINKAMIWLLDYCIKSKFSDHA